MEMIVVNCVVLLPDDGYGGETEGVVLDLFPEYNIANVAVGSYTTIYPIDRLIRKD